jgi:subtilisin family serine protease
VVAASGNDGGSQLLFPAGYLPVIGVGAVDQNDVLAGYSNHGPGLDFTAPGGEDVPTLTSSNSIQGLGYDSSASQNPSCQYLAVGTSFSAPHVSALAAMLINLGWTDPEAIRLRMAQTADDLGPAGWDERYGYGRINADRATRPDVAPGPNPFQDPSGSLGRPFAYPNPYHPNQVPHAVLTFRARAGVLLRLRIFDGEDRRVWERVLDPARVGTYNEIVWDGRNGRGDRVGSGVYVIVAEQDGKLEYGKIAVIGR